LFALTAVRSFKAQLASGEPPRVLGCLLGTHSGRVVDIANSFELKVDGVVGGVPQIDSAFLARKQDQCESAAVAGASLGLTALTDKKVFPKLDIVGWYGTGAVLQDADLVLQRTVRLPQDVGGGSSPSYSSSADDEHH